MTTDPKWITLGRKREIGRKEATFYNGCALARIPRPAGSPSRGDWQIRNDDPSSFRFVYSDDGGYKASAYSAEYSVVSKSPLERYLGHSLTGRYSARIEGNAVLISIDGEG